VYAGTRGALTIADERVIPLTLDVASAAQIRQAAHEVDTRDVLINNAGIALYDDLSRLEVIREAPGRQSLWNVQVCAEQLVAVAEEHICQRAGR